LTPGRGLTTLLAMNQLQPTHAQVFKIRMMHGILDILKERGPMKARDLAHELKEIHLHSLHRYLDELLTMGHVRKVHAKGERKNIRAYEYRSDYGAKNDILSQALSHPSHQLLMSMTSKTPNNPSSSEHPE